MTNFFDETLSPTILPEHFATLKKLKKVTIETTIVEGHAHTLYIDPADKRWVVPGGTTAKVPV